MLQPPKLTARERQILPMLLVGATRKEIGEDLGISPETVKLHTTNLLRKFDAANLRDGIADMLTYQHYYGIGGISADRFIHSADLHVVVIENGNFLRINTKINLKVMSEHGIEKLYFSQMVPPDKLRLEGAALNVTGPVYKDMRSWYTLTPDAPLKEGVDYAYEFTVTAECFPGEPHSFYIEETTFPASNRSYSLSFENCDPVSDYGYEVFMGLQKVQNYKIEEQISQKKIQYRDSNPKVPLRFKLWWAFTG